MASPRLLRSLLDGKSSRLVDGDSSGLISSSAIHAEDRFRERDGVGMEYCMFSSIVE